MHARVVAKRFLKYPAAIVSNVFRGGADSAEPLLVLMYHRVNRHRKNELSITPDEFGRQVAWLKAGGFDNVRLSDLESRPHGGVPGTRGVLFTFDDGYEDNYLEAFPVLEEFGYTAVFYIPVGYIETGRAAVRDVRESNRPEHNRFMSWGQIAELLGAGMEIGSHGIDHAVLTGLPPEEAWREISESKRMLEEKLGAAVTSFCYPKGCYDRSHRDMVARAGYRTACTASPKRSAPDDMLQLPRLAVLRSDAFSIFKQKIRGRMDWFSLVR